MSADAGTPRGTAGAGRFRRRGEAVTRRIAGECLLVPLKGELADLQRVFALNPVAERVWELLGSSERSLRELSESVAASFTVERETAERDLTEFLAQLEREGLVESAGAE